MFNTFEATANFDDWPANVAGGVIVETVEVQTSFAPIRIVTMFACCATAVCACS